MNHPSPLLSFFVYLCPFDIIIGSWKESVPRRQSSVGCLLGRKRNWVRCQLSKGSISMTWHVVLSCISIWAWILNVSAMNKRAHLENVRVMINIIQLFCINPSPQSPFPVHTHASQISIIYAHHLFTLLHLWQAQTTINFVSSSHSSTPAIRQENSSSVSTSTTMTITSWKNANPC